MSSPFRLAFSLLMCVLPASGAAAPTDAWIEAGIERLYGLDVPAAEAEFRKVRDAMPDHPDGYYGLAAAAWMLATYGPRRGDKDLEAEFQARVEEAVRKGRAWLKARPADGRARLTLGGSYGLRSRHALMQGRWLSAVMDGRRALKEVRAAQRAAPDLYDVYLGIGMWEYYADVFPRFVKALGKLVLGGDREQGLKHLRLTAERGRFCRITAQLVLIEIYTEDRLDGRNPALALELIRKLIASQPASPLYRQIEQAVLYAAGDYPAVIRSSEEYLRRIDSGAPFFDGLERARMHLGVGMARWKLGDLAGARHAMERAAGLAGGRPRPAQWAAWALVRLGQLLDRMGLRPEALERYKAELALPDLWGYHALARRYIKRPFPASAELGPLPPPDAL